jgi:hypothetical protein
MNPIFENLRKRLAMILSDNPGERANAADALHRFMVENDIHPSKLYIDVAKRIPGKRRIKDLETEVRQLQSQISKLQTDTARMEDSIRDKDATIHAYKWMVDALENRAYR